ncbi:LOW QUALITY PROTEIN: protein unc-45 homolog A-like [Pecten maximus]|uniref:LOW QUALITY PROTEIN: protein unc-45 homolog A-like n=1 Tax=Pecten maximus TaxID=6579 RepID=UPI0014591953|nr:LOW QUALITY PROTEIN: protein unc-45 homolog A-like [Pecten maximus]
MSDPLVLKEEGNKFFKDGDLVAALTCYTNALDISDLKDADKAAIYKNMAACHLKQEKYTEAIEDATAALEVNDNDPKALYRRCLAYEKLGKVEEAYKDAGALIKVDPKNTAIQPVICRLTPLIQEKMKQQNSTSAKVSQMFNLAFDSASDDEKKLQALNNLVVLAREEAGAKFICDQSGVQRLRDLLEGRNLALIQAAIRVLACVCSNSTSRSWLVSKEIGIKRLGLLMWEPSEALATSTGKLIETMLIKITGLDVHRQAEEEYQAKRKRAEPCRRPRLEINEDQREYLKETFHMLIKMLQNYKVSGEGRDAAMELLIKNMLRKNGLQWTRDFLETDGVEGLLAVAGAIKQHETLPVTENSKMHAAVALSNIYDDLYSDKESDKFKAKCSEYFKDLFGDEIFESKIEALKAISTLLQGPYEVGSMILGFEGVTKIMFALADSNNVLHQQIAVEAIVHSAQKQKRCNSLLAGAVPILKKLYQTAEDSIKVRALVGLCKLGTSGGSDASNKPMAEGSTLAMAKSCRRFLNNPSKDVDLRRWATEGLAFLTLDAEVKEDLVNDVSALKSLIDVTAKAEKNILYPASTVFVNITNSYDQKEIVPEMVELAKYAKQHVPEEHEKDKPEFVKKRVMTLANSGVVTALVALSNAESKNTREQLSRIFLALTNEEELRGLVVAQGGAKALMGLAMDNNTDKGQPLAAQALAKITITMNPETTFPGQRMYELVRPMLNLLHIDNTALQNFEGLMALTNLSSISDSLRKRIVAEKGVSMIENYMTEEHEMLSRASTECMCNLVMNEEVVKMYEMENDRTKLMTLYCAEEDPHVVKAASGALAILTHSPIVCKRVVQVNSWYEILQSLLVEESVEVQHRGCYIVMNLMCADKDIAAKLVEGQLLEILMALSILDDPTRAESRKCVVTALEKAVEYELIKSLPNANKS